jgi:hypothetical protein
MNKLLWCLIAAIPLAAQTTPGWRELSSLGSDIHQPGAWYGAGLWSGDHHGPAPFLTDSLGLGNSLTGGGIHLEGGYRNGHWDLAAEVLANRNPVGQDYLTLYRSHIWYRGDHGWQGGFEQEPLVWGYGLNGGYLLGEAARPFPRMRIESPMADLHLFRIPLGTWGWQAFMGRMENHPVLSSAIQNPSLATRLINTNGNPEAPFLNGYRIQAQFGPLMEFYLNTINFWGGTLNGKSLLQGYRATDLATAMLGIKDGLTEANTDYSDPNVTQAPPNLTRAVSATQIDVGFRLRSPFLARMLRADTSYLYLSRGSKSALWPVAVFVKQPFYYLGKDLTRDTKDVLLKPNWGAWWNTNSRYTAPSLNQPNDTVGIQVTWSRVRAGLEYFACSDGAVGNGFRPYTHGTYVTGFYYYGDPLGNPLGGESVSTTAKVEVDFTRRLMGATTVVHGFRPFRDNLADWQLDHPGATPGRNTFTGLQQTLAWKRSESTTLEMGGSWQREGAVNNVTGAMGNGFAWFADVTFHWPARD